MITAVLLVAAFQSVEPQPVEATRGILEAIQEHRLVALGESHDLKETWDFYTQLVTDDRFPDAASDVVLEIANSRHQALLDGFLLHGDVSLEEVRAVWREATNAPLQDGDPPGMEAFLVAVREANRHRLPQRRTRVLAGDPPIDWSAVEGPNEFYRYLNMREQYYADVVRREVLERGRKALLIMGRGHMARVSTREDGNTAQRIEAMAPGELFIANLLTDQAPAIVRAAARWPTPALVPTKGNWLGDLTPDFLAPSLRADGVTYEAAVDAVLFLGLRPSLTEVPSTPWDQAHIDERDGWMRAIGREGESPGGEGHEADTGEEIGWPRKSPRAWLPLLADPGRGPAGPRGRRNTESNPARWVRDAYMFGGKPASRVSGSGRGAHLFGHGRCDIGPGDRVGHRCLLGSGRGRAAPPSIL